MAECHGHAHPRLDVEFGELRANTVGAFAAYFGAAVNDWPTAAPILGTISRAAPTCRHLQQPCRRRQPPARSATTASPLGRRITASKVPSGTGMTLDPHGRFLMHALPRDFATSVLRLAHNPSRANNIARVGDLLAVPLIAIDAIKAPTPIPKSRRRPCRSRMPIIETFLRG